MNNLGRAFPWVVVGIAVLYFVVTMWPPSDQEGRMAVHEFGKIPVQHRGRIKPIDTLARTNLMVISGRQTFLDEKDRTQPAVRWWLDAVTSQLPGKGSADRYQDVRIDDPKLLEFVGLKPRPGNRYAITEFANKVPALFLKANEVRAIPPIKQGDFDRNVIELASDISIYIQLIQWENPDSGRGLPYQVMNLSLPFRGVAEGYKVFRIDNDQLVDLLKLEKRPGSWRYSIREFQPRLKELENAVAAAQGRDAKDRNLFDQKVIDFRQHLELYLSMAQWHEPYIIPPHGSGNDWQTLRTAARQASESRMMDSGSDPKEKDPGLESIASMLRAYALEDTALFNKELAAYRKRMETERPAEVASANFEVFFNHFAPFYQCSVLYLFVFLFACVSWIAWSKPLNQAAFWLALVTVLIHSWALCARMYLQGRPPVTNLYSSAVFIGWGCVLLCLGLEAIYRNGIANVVGAVLGSLTMFIAHFLGGSGDTLEMMQAVLDTNFWLATHVTCITLGYTATFVAGFVALAYILFGVLTPVVNREVNKAIGEMVYGIICFATLLSFVGTVLGGIWADVSWGRFWGWDPKENGALLIVIWNALILHARWGGLVQQRGMAILAVVGNMITGWSWFGTNQLGVGLHAYGFNNKLALGLVLFWISQLAVIGIGLVPRKHWWSFSAQQEPLPRERKPREGRGTPAVAVPS